MGGGVNFAIFSRHASRVRLELFDHPGRRRARPGYSIWIQRATAPATYGTFGWRGSVPVNSMPTAWMALTNPAKDIVSISTGSSSIPSRPRFRNCPRGILHRHVDTTRRRRSKTWLSRSWTIPGRCRNASSSTSPSSGMEDQPPGIRGRRPSFTKSHVRGLPHPRFQEEHPFYPRPFANSCCAVSDLIRVIESDAELKAQLRAEDRCRQQRSTGIECSSHSQVQVEQVCGFLYFFLLRPCPQARRRHVSARAGRRSGLSPAGRLHRKHSHVRPDRGRFGDSKHSSHGLQVHVREAGFVRIAE